MSDSLVLYNSRKGCKRLCLEHKQIMFLSCCNLASSVILFASTNTRADRYNHCVAVVLITFLVAREETFCFVFFFFLSLVKVSLRDRGRCGALVC